MATTIAKALPIRVERARRSASRPASPVAGWLLAHARAALDPRAFWRAFRDTVVQSDGDWAGSTRYFR